MTKIEWQQIHATRKREGRLDVVPGALRTRATCHPERHHFARGMCRSCYGKQWRAAFVVAK